MLPGGAPVPYAKSVSEMGAVAPVPISLVTLLRKGKPSTLCIWAHVRILEDLILMTSIKHITE